MTGKQSVLSIAKMLPGAILKLNTTSDVEAR
jgi:hypothetical protein